MQGFAAAAGARGSRQMAQSSRGVAAAMAEVAGSFGLGMGGDDGVSDPDDVGVRGMSKSAPR